MKRVLIFAMLLACSMGAFAQGGLTINNTVANCDLYISMTGFDLPSGFGLCTLYSPTFVVPASTTMVWNCVFDFQGPTSTACSSLSAPIGWASGASIPVSSLTFQWTDATFQFKCLTPPYCPSGGRMSDCASSCWSAGAPWPGPCFTGYWTPLCGTYMSAVTITF